MTRKILLACVLVLLASALWGQSLQDNEYYRKMVELKAQSEAAFEEGDYVEARRLAEESRSYKELSDEWIETQLAAYRARSALNRVKDRIAEATRMKAAVNFPEELAKGQALYDQAYSEFRGETYVQSRETSLQALEVMSVIVYIAPEGNLPAYYKVRLLPGNKDCLWNISGYEFIYDNPLLWQKIYEANKDIMPQRDNPHLIHPNMILKIPARDGESRSGTWIDGEIE